MSSPKKHKESFPLWGWISISAMIFVIAVTFAILSGAMSALGGALAELLHLLLPACGIILLALLYFLPYFMAGKSPRATAIFVANLVFGWTIFGWVIVLIWALAESGTAKAKEEEAKE